MTIVWEKRENLSQLKSNSHLYIRENERPRFIILYSRSIRPWVSGNSKLLLAIQCDPKVYRLKLNRTYRGSRTEFIKSKVPSDVRGWESAAKTRCESTRPIAVGDHLSGALSPEERKGEGGEGDFILAPNWGKSNRSESGERLCANQLSRAHP